MMYATRYATTVAGWLAFAGRPRQVATGCRMRANIVMRPWPKSYSGGVLAHLQNLQPRFGDGRTRRGLTRRFKRTIHVVDLTTIQLVGLVRRLGSASSAQGRRQVPSATRSLSDLRNDLSRQIIAVNLRHGLIRP